MTDSPAFRGPIDPNEQPILDSLLQIRDNLLILKSDKSQYIKSQDVIEQYDKVLEQIANLNDIRKTKPDEENRLDTVLDDCLQLISLFFLTIGRNNEAPAAYSVASTIKVGHRSILRVHSVDNIAAITRPPQGSRLLQRQGSHSHRCPT